MASSSPQRFTPRAGSSMPGRVRRALDGQIDTQRRLGPSLDVDRDGRMVAKLAPNSGLKETRQGLALDAQALGEKNRPQMARIKDPASSSAADVHATVIELLEALRRSGRMK